jgi:hypothetical protein
MLGPRVVLAQGSNVKGTPPACPGVSQRRARSGPWTAHATVRRASDSE